MGLTCYKHLALREFNHVLESQKKKKKKKKKNADSKRNEKVKKKYFKIVT